MQGLNSYIQFTLYIASSYLPTLWSSPVARPHLIFAWPYHGACLILNCMAGLVSDHHVSFQDSVLQDPALSSGYATIITCQPFGGRCASVSQTDRPTDRPHSSTYETRKTKKKKQFTFFFFHIFSSLHCVAYVPHDMISHGITELS